jgi:hypothetical protein
MCVAFASWLLIGGSAFPSAARTTGPSLPIARTAFSCLPTLAPDEHSLLLVLLDRSSSLAQTDPEEYSTSVTRIMANLWPGRMAVLFFSGTSKQVPQLGPVDLTQPGARERLQTQIEAQRNALHGDTPTQYAVEQAAQILAQNGYPRGSQVMLITDGQPFLPADQQGTKQIATIEQQDAPGFCTHGVPITPFGLGNQVSPVAQAFLRQVAAETGGEYQDVTDPGQLAAPVVQLYANWQQFQFASTSGHHQFRIDTYAGQVDFIAFLSNRTTFPVTLLGPNQQPVPAQELLQQAQDPHYQLEQMAVQRFNPPGVYTIQTADPTAQTYALVKTRLQAAIVSPTPHTPVYAGKPLTVSVVLYDNNDPQQHIHPTQNDIVTIGLTYALQKGGKTVASSEKMLVQQPAPNDDLFSTQITPLQTGTLMLLISASYQYVPLPHPPSVIVQVLASPLSSCPLIGSACQGGQGGLILLAFVVLVFLIVLLFFFLLWRRPRPFGVLENSQGQRTPIGHNRSFLDTLVHPSTVSSEAFPRFDFQGARFSLHFQRGHRVLLVTGQNTPSLAIWCAQAADGQRMQPVKTDAPVLLHQQDRILVNGVPCATFHQHAFSS